MLDYFLKSRGILGINARNQKYIRPSGFKRALRIIDSKLVTKKILKKAGLLIPQTYGKIRSRKELYQFDWEKLPESFILKPNRGFSGRGILIVYGKKKGKQFHWIRADKDAVGIRELQEQILNILDGYYSITGLPDIAFFEERMKIAKIFKSYTYKGVPDVRIVVYNKIPVMAELRLPTKESGGKANLHLGAIGVGIDMATGLTTNAVLYDKLIEYIPGTRINLRGIKIPYWSEILELAVKAQLATNIGFLGVDIAIDRDKGPVILELNARPGLSIQIANLAPLKERLERVKGLRVKTPKRAIKIAKNLFGSEEEGELEEAAGKKIIGANEVIEIFGKEGEKIETIAKIDTGAYRSTICRSIADKLNEAKTQRYKIVRSVLGKEERPIIDLKFKLDGKVVETQVFIADRSEMKKDMIIGRKDLKEFLVDPAKNILLGQTAKK